MKLNKMLQLVDNMVLYSKDYDILNNLLNNLDSKLFVKIMEEILEGNLYFSDFERFFTEDYEKQLEINLENQKRIKTEISRMIYFKQTILEESYTFDGNTNMIGIPRPSDLDTELLTLYETLSEEERQSIIYHLFDFNESETVLERAAKLIIRDNLLSETTEYNEQDLLLFADSYIIPIDFKHQIINDNDINFMLENNLTEDQIKKMKSLSIFLRRKENGGI